MISIEYVKSQKYVEDLKQMTEREFRNLADKCKRLKSEIAEHEQLIMLSEEKKRELELKLKITQELAQRVYDDLQGLDK